MADHERTRNQLAEQDGYVHRLRTRTSTQFWTAFWVVIVCLAAITGYAQWKLSQPRVAIKDGILVVSPEWADEWQKIADELIATNRISFDQGSRARLRIQIDTQIEAAFAPVYGQIPRLADFHYSILGEYTELIAVLTSDGASSLQRILFDEIGFDARLNGASDQVNQEFLSILGAAIGRIKGKLDSAPDLTPEERNILAGALQLTDEAVRARFSNELIALRTGGAGLGGVLVASKAAGKKAAAALAKKVGAKASAKAATKAITPAAAGTGGAILCAGFGPIVAGVCGAVAAGGAWIVTDAVIVTVDEALNREEFEAEMRDIVDEQKRSIKDALAAEYDSLFDMISADLERRIQATTPAEAVRQAQ